MTLADLKQGESAVIVKIRGRGAFRKRLTEMGFVSGHQVTVVQYAPLKDPIGYRILTSNVSLRRSEATLVDVVPLGEFVTPDTSIPFDGIVEKSIVEKKFKEKGKTIDVVLVGNPNSGKTSLFNVASGLRERTGNYSGVTVGAKTTLIKRGDYRIRIGDLPGTYSTSAYSKEESFVRQYLFEHSPDIVINVIDASNLERNLFLTTQLIDMDVRVIAALNMYDELQSNGDTLNYHLLERMIGIPFVPTVAVKRQGIDQLLDRVIEVFEDRDPVSRYIQINYGEHVEASINKIQEKIQQSKNFVENVSPRYHALKLLEEDKEMVSLTQEWRDYEEVEEVVSNEIKKIESLYHEDGETIIQNARYGFISGLMKETLKRNTRNKQQDKALRIDNILVHKIFGYPIFFFFVWLMFYATFRLGEYPKEGIEYLVSLFSEWLSGVLPESFIAQMLTDGIISGVGEVIVFLPNILILFFFISVMESTGYMARVAFLMDHLMHKIGLHGKSFIPLIMGFGCNVPAIMATRTLENKRDRLLTILIMPFMSCSARLPVFILLIGVFFPSSPVLALTLLYLFGIILAILFALVFKKLVYRSKATPFVMELPPYRIPTLKAVLLDMWSKAKLYLKKMGGVILIASMIIWLLGYFPQRDADRLEESYIAQIGHFIEPVVAPLGFDWKMGVSLISGIAAKEVVISTMGVLYEHDSEVDVEILSERIQKERYTSGPKEGQLVFTPVVAASYLVFILLYFPCIAVFAAVGRETGRWWWAIFIAVYTTALAWILSFVVYQIGQYLWG